MCYLLEENPKFYYVNFSLINILTISHRCITLVSYLKANVMPAKKVYQLKGNKKSFSSTPSISSLYAKSYPPLPSLVGVAIFWFM